MTLTRFLLAASVAAFVLVGLAGAAALLGGKFLVDVSPLCYAGTAALGFASVWSVRIPRATT